MVSKNSIVVQKSGIIGEVVATHTYPEAGQYASVRSKVQGDANWIPIEQLRLASKEEVLTFKGE